MHRLAPVYRLDRETAGVLVFNVQPHTGHAHQRQRRELQMHKGYETIAPW